MVDLLSALRIAQNLEHAVRLRLLDHIAEYALGSIFQDTGFGECLREQNVPYTGSLRLDLFTQGKIHCAGSEGVSRRRKIRSGCGASGGQDYVCYLVAAIAYLTDKIP